MSLTPTGSRSFGEKGSTFRLVVVAVLVAPGIGTFVFRSIEGWSILTSLYVTVQTVTTELELVATFGQRRRSRRMS